MPSAQVVHGFQMEVAQLTPEVSPLPTEAQAASGGSREPQQGPELEGKVKW